MSTGSRALVSSAVFVVLAAALLCAASASASTSTRQLKAVEYSEEFPPKCKCERSPDMSPFRLVLNAPSPARRRLVEGDLTSYCFTVTDTAACDKTNKCCNGKQGVNKIEFDVASTCKSALKSVTVDGDAWSAWEFNTQLGVVRVTNLKKDAAEAAGTEVCLQLKTASVCPTLTKFCAEGDGQCKYAIFNDDRDCCPVAITTVPTPPPINNPLAPAFGREPPPPSVFPFCQCQRSASGSKLYISPKVKYSVVGGLDSMCFTVNTTGVCDADSKCCEFTLHKLEIEADVKCAPSLVYTTVNGDRRARFFQQRPYPVLKVTNIVKEYADAIGTEVCLFFKPNTCGTLEDLCVPHDGTCTMALFSKPGSLPATCCPIFTI